MSDVTSRLVARFRWVDGHADVWRLFSDGDLFSLLVRCLADPFRAAAITKVVGIEARGFILGGAVANELGSGFVAIRKQGGLLPGEKLVRPTPPDYRHRTSKLRLQRQSLATDDRVLLVDDWVETGSQALTARALVEEAGAVFVGASVIVDELPVDVRPQLGTFSALVGRASLGPSG